MFISESIVLTQERPSWIWNAGHFVDVFQYLGIILMRPKMCFFIWYAAWTLLFSASAWSSGIVSEKKCFQPKHVFELEYASDPQISPDGKAPHASTFVLSKYIRFATTLGPLAAQQHVAPNRYRFPHGYGPSTVSQI